MSIIWFVFWQAVGLAVIRSQFYPKRLTVRLWLGSITGSLLSMWMPVLFAFIFDFTVKAHVFALILGAVIGIGAWLSARRHVPSLEKDPADRGILLFSLPVLALCLVMLFNHTLREVNGALYTGQCTYGDMSMHLGFITSISAQGTFPPNYSILPGVKLCYPFLCDSVSASLYLLGLPLRWAYILPSVTALAQVIFGFCILACEIAGEKGAGILAAVFFFFNGGFGTLYFLNGKYSFSELFNGFYVTPTNLTDEGMRWVNVIADMLIPQRATLFGWAVLFGALYLLYRAVFRNDHFCALPAGIMGGLLPMIHTHSFFALGLVAICWLIYSLVHDGWNRQWLSLWLKFGLCAVVLALPQLLIWTFNSVGGNEQFLRIGIDWVNGLSENPLWFWLKNVGLLFLLTPIAFFTSDEEKQGVFCPIFFIFILCELVLFQPNPYDNNKLFYIGYLFACILCADSLLSWLKRRGVRWAVLVPTLILCTNAALLTLAREVYSGTDRANYQLFSRCETEAAEFIKENTAPDAVFLTSDNHNNTVAVLTGRNIVCGTPSYLYFHGLDYRQAEGDAQTMLRGGEDFEALCGKYNVDYVYIGPHERGKDADEAYFSSAFTQVFKSGNVTIYRINR